MATKSKRQLLREKVSAPRRKRTPADREKMGRDMISRKRTAPPPFERVLILLEPEELRFLDSFVAALKPELRGISRSKVIRQGIALMKNMDPDELRRQFR
jgi:hypothetical protein